MNMQQMMAQAQKMQRELRKAQLELDQKQFTCTKGGAVTVTMKGSHEVLSVEIDNDAFTADDKEMVQDMIVMAINELMGQIDKARGDINERITGQRGGLGF